jgi:hypothetical protein
MYATAAETITSAVVATPVPYVTVYPNGTEVTSWSTVTAVGNGTNATATFTGLPTYSAPTWTFHDLTL